VDSVVEVSVAPIDSIDYPGLEFAIVQRIVEARDGEFGIESGEEIGSIVKVQLVLVVKK
jgi:signal transduction histidine kinase